MPLGRNPEEARRRAAEWEATRIKNEQEAARKRYWESAVGQADAARQNGARFFQVSLKESEVKGKSTDWSFSQSTTTTRVHGATDVLGQIEEFGWHLEHVGYVFVETGAVDRNKAFTGGSVTRTDGYVQGTYLFRAIQQKPNPRPENAGVQEGGQ